MDRAIFDEWWEALLKTQIFGELVKGITLRDVTKYLDELHEKVERYDLLKREIATLKALINRL